MFLELSGTTIIGHSQIEDSQFTQVVSISARELAPDSEYIFKFEGGALVSLDADQIATHPNRKAIELLKVSQQSFNERLAILPDYKITNALQGIDTYDAATVTSYKNTVNAFRDEYYRVKALIDPATTKAAIDSAMAGVNFPVALVP